MGEFRNFFEAIIKQKGKGYMAPAVERSLPFLPARWMGPDGKIHTGTSFGDMHMHMIPALLKEYGFEKLPDKSSMGTAMEIGFVRIPGSSYFFDYGFHRLNPKTTQAIIENAKEALASGYYVRAHYVEDPDNDFVSKQRVEVQPYGNFGKFVNFIHKFV